MTKYPEEMTRKELVHVYVDVYGGKLSDLGDGYVPIGILREAVAVLLDADPVDEPQSVATATSDFEFVDMEEAEALDAEASEQVEWYRVPGSSARRVKK